MTVLVETQDLINTNNNKVVGFTTRLFMNYFFNNFFLKMEV